MACFRCAVETPPSKRPCTSLRPETTSSDTFLLPTMSDFDLSLRDTAVARECCHCSEKVVRWLIHSYISFLYSPKHVIVKLNMFFNKDSLLCWPCFLKLTAVFANAFIKTIVCLLLQLPGQFTNISANEVSVCLH